MCGICGIVSLEAEDPIEDLRLARMLQDLTHRGPDEQGIYRSAGARLGIRRLRVIDLKTGSQPITTEDRTLTVVFNGEIYNFRELRGKLEARGHRFRTQSDTEVILLGFREWSCDVFDRLDGMFAIAIWDEPTRHLILARDRIGEKPLYWADEGGRFVFASEMRAIQNALTRPLTTDDVGFARYLFYGYSPSPGSLLRGVQKLQPSEILIYSSGGVQVTRFWSPPVAPRTAEDVPAKLRQLQSEILPAAVRSRLISDVPLGAFLSGGIDSTTIVDAMVAAEAATQTFSIGFEDPTYDESKKARRVAQQLVTRHSERFFTEAELAGLLPHLTQIINEPLADPSILPTYLLSRLAREQVTVALSGDGGDELFGGYPTYLAHLWTAAWNGAGKPLALLLRAAASALPASDANLSIDFRLAKLSLGLGHEPAWRHALWMSHCSPRQISSLLPDLAGSGLRDLLFEPIEGKLADRRFETDLDLAMHIDLAMYLADGVLMKVDRASMACSLETRAPFLARSIVELALSLPATAKIGWKTTKKPLRQLLETRYPKSIVRQPKKGFGIPVSRWLRTVARDAVQENLKELPVNGSAVAKLWNEHQSGWHNHRMPLWALFVFGNWKKTLHANPSI